MSLFIHYHYHRIKNKVEEVGGKASFDYLSHWGFPSYVFNESFMPPNFKKKLKIVIENGEEFFVIIREKPEKPFIHRCKVSGMWMHIVNMGGIAGGPGMRVGFFVFHFFYKILFHFS